MKGRVLIKGLGSGLDVTGVTGSATEESGGGEGWRGSERPVITSF